MYGLLPDSTTNIGFFVIGLEFPFCSKRYLGSEDKVGHYQDILI